MDTIIVGAATGNNDWRNFAPPKPPANHKNGATPTQVTVRVPLSEAVWWKAKIPQHPPSPVSPQDHENVHPVPPQQNQSEKEGQHA